MKKRMIHLLLVSVFTATTLIGCKQTVPVSKPGSHARISEVLVVLDKALWEGELGDSVRSALGTFYPYLNQPEPMFSIIYRDPADFDETYSVFRNILLFVLEPERDGGTIQKETDHWAKPQTVIQLNGNTSETLLGLFEKNREAIMKAFDDSEIRRLKGVMKSINKEGNAQQIAKNLGVNIAVPEGYYLAKQKTGFVWARKVIKSQTQESSFWIATVPYTDTAQFSPDRILALRDSVCKAHIPVQDQVSYMGTETRFGALSKVIRLNGYYTVETRGFWRTFGNHSMGGPFLNYLVLDEKKERLVMIDCYVFKPNENKRDLIRQLEGIVHTLQL
ncbi:MAG TPA: DUF4837 family protein [Bacteroidales bacterium]|nr:DUF4837 family protein [Bacteroidales bacterium]HRZ48778.1 DUF4837 family protein [Bacteroidales bacterium]